MSKEKFLKVMDEKIYISDENKHRFLSKKETKYVKEFDLEKIGNGKLTFQYINLMEVYPVMKLPERVKEILIRRYPNHLTEKETDEIVRVFRGGYLLKLSATLSKNKKQSFSEVNTIVLNEMLKKKFEIKKETYSFVDERDIEEIQKEIDKYFYNKINWYDVISLGRSVKLKIENKKIVIKKVRLTYKKEDEQREVFLKSR